MEEPILITVGETSKLLHIGKNTLYKIIRENKTFPCLKLPHKLLIDKNQLSTWVSKNYGSFEK